jgi:hypothetical protein
MQTVESRQTKLISNDECDGSRTQREESEESESDRMNRSQRR